MTIDRVTTNLYTCCKCKYRWTRWNGNGNGDQSTEATTILLPITITMPLPRRCPKCKSERWNQRYLDEELALSDRLQDELYETGLIKESGERIDYEGNETLGTKPRTIFPYDYDFISYDFLKQILPQPELFELRQVLAIPKEDIEARHDYMLSVIKDRVDNAEVYEREYFSKYPNYGYSRRKIGFSIDDLWEPKKKKYFPGRRRIMNSSTKCTHRPVHEIENKLYPDYDDGSFQRMYIGLVDMEEFHEPGQNNVSKRIMLNPKFNWFLSDPMITKIIPHAHINSISEGQDSLEESPMAAVHEDTFWQVFEELLKEEEQFNDSYSDVDKNTINGKKLEKRLLSTGEFYNGDAAKMIRRMVNEGKLEEVMLDTYRRI